VAAVSAVRDNANEFNCTPPSPLEADSIALLGVAIGLR